MDDYVIYLPVNKDSEAVSFEYVEFDLREPNNPDYALIDGWDWKPFKIVPITTATDDRGTVMGELTTIDRDELAELRAEVIELRHASGVANQTIASLQSCQESAAALIEECRAALSAELTAWDIEPPLHHIKQAHDKCVAWLAERQPAPKGGERCESYSPLHGTRLCFHCGKHQLEHPDQTKGEHS